MMKVAHLVCLSAVLGAWNCAVAQIAVVDFERVVKLHPNTGLAGLSFDQGRSLLRHAAS